MFSCRAVYLVNNCVMLKSNLGMNHLGQPVLSLIACLRYIVNIKTKIICQHIFKNIKSSTKVRCSFIVNNTFKK